MLRAPVKLHELLVGKPLPFDVYDRDGRLLLRRGYVIETDQEKQRLFKLGPERDISTDERFRAALESAQRVEVKGSDEEKRAVSLGFDELHLVPGELLQIKIGSEEQPLWARYVGMLRNKSLLIDAVTRNDVPIFIREGTTLQIKGTSGSYAFLFSASLLANVSKPFPYHHLTYPGEVKALRLRRSDRVPVRLVCAVLTEDGTPHGGVLLDLSLGGGLLATRHPLQVGETVTLKFKIDLAGSELILSVRAQVRSQRKLDAAHLRGGEGYGVQFLDLTPEETIALMTYIRAVQAGAVA
ncbi:MAG TPA: PilZ domain-containing protein [Hydrogenophilus thermoluteolus]|nr:PilZ domain-containing protein [Hydrogenophilus thermoluteolus]